MNNPCNNCLVKSACTQRCIDYAKFTYENKYYGDAGIKIKKYINMPYNKMILYILMIENAFLKLKF